MSDKRPKIVVPGLNRGIGVPAGYVLGRQRGSGKGPAELLDLNQLQALGVGTKAHTVRTGSTIASTAHSETVSLSTSVSTQISSVVSVNTGQSTSLSQISSSLSGAISTNVGQSTSLSQISSSLSGAISSTTSLSTAVSTVISGSISTINSRIDSLSAAIGGGGTIAVQDEGTPVGVFTTLNFSGTGVAATDAGGGVALIDIAGGGGGAGTSTSLSQISSSLSSEISSRISGDTSLSTVISSETSSRISGDTSLSTVISGSISTVNSSITSLSTAIGGGSAWALAGTSWAATGVYDQAVDGTQANVTFLGLSGKSDIMVIMAATTLSVSGQEQLQVSIDNGSNWLTTSGDYISIDSGGQTANVPGARFVDTNHTAARHATMVVWGANVTGPPKIMDLLPRGSGGKLVHFIASTSPINAVRVNGSNGGNISGGKIYCLAR